MAARTRSAGVLHCNRSPADLPNFSNSDGHRFLRSLRRQHSTMADLVAQYTDKMKARRCRLEPCAMRRTRWAREQGVRGRACLQDLRSAPSHSPTLRSTSNTLLTSTTHHYPPVDPTSLLTTSTSTPHLHHHHSSPPLTLRQSDGCSETAIKAFLYYIGSSNPSPNPNPDHDPSPSPNPDPVGSSNPDPNPNSRPSCRTSARTLALTRAALTLTLSIIPILTLTLTLTPTLTPSLTLSR